MMTSTIKRRKVERRSKGAGLAIAAFLLWSLVSACGPNEGVLRSGKSDAASTNSTPTRSTIETDIEDMRTADLTYVYVLRRKDGGDIDSEDRGMIKIQTDGVNRRVSSDNGKAFVLGSKSAISADKMRALYDRFAVENYSQPESLIVNGNVNAK